MSDNSKWYYTDNTGAQVGPVPTSELKSLISEGRVPASGLAWKEGVADWQGLSQIPELQDISTSPPAAMKTAQPTASPAVDPYKTPAARLNTATASSFDHDEYGGIRRLNYFLRNLLLVIVTGIAVASIFVFLLKGDLENLLSPVVILGGLGLLGVFLIFGIRIAYLRITNIGYSGWWLLFMFVPLANNILNIVLIALPEGFAHHKKLDIPAIILIALNILLLIASFSAEYIIPSYLDTP